MVAGLIVMTSQVLAPLPLPPDEGAAKVLVGADVLVGPVSGVLDGAGVAVSVAVAAGVNDWLAATVWAAAVANPSTELVGVPSAAPKPHALSAKAPTSKMIANFVLDMFLYTP